LPGGSRGLGDVYKRQLFSDRLVAKFKLPVEGWRGE
jgi:hypothetical protein